MTENRTRQELERLLAMPSVAHAVYFLVIVTTGLYFLKLTLRNDIVMGSSLLYMGLWLVVIIALQPPKAAQLGARPFETPEVIDETLPAEIRTCQSCGIALKLSVTTCHYCGEPVESS